jgi:hypothetical protein
MVPGNRKPQRALSTLTYGSGLTSGSGGAGPTGASGSLGSQFGSGMKAGLMTSGHKPWDREGILRPYAGARGPRGVGRRVSSRFGRQVRRTPTPPSAMR